MLSKKNILLIEDEGYEFIIGERIRNLPKAIHLSLTVAEPKTKGSHRRRGFEKLKSVVSQKKC
jgi:hypothetical protein